MGKGRSQEDFIKICEEVHNNKYDYSNTVYKTSHDKIEIICPEHGVFWQKANSHIRGAGCPKCKGIGKTTDEIVSEFKQVHGNKYDYSQVVFNKAHKKVKIVCPEHGVFYKTPSNILRGQGCPKCIDWNTSKSEKELVSFLESCNVQCETGNRKILKGKELDIYIPSKKLAIEYNGLYWHNELNVVKDYHYSKMIGCRNMGVQLLHIWDDDWLHKKSTIKSFIKAKLGIFEKILNGRDCCVKEVNSKEYKQFLNDSHLQGYVGASTKLGLYHNNELVAVMGFKKENNKVYNLNRFSNKKDYMIRGGFSKLLNYFVKRHTPYKIISFSDNSYSDGGLYKTNGFSQDLELDVDYMYIHNNQRRHKFGYRKQQLKKMFNLSDEYVKTHTEHEICLANNLYRIYDCGKIKWVKYFCG